MRPFVIVGFGRCGMHFTTTLLTHLGLSCTHEGHFNLHTPTTPIQHSDGSWLAMPHLDKLPPGTPVVHLMRNPARSIASWLANVSDPNPYLDFACQHASWNESRTDRPRMMATLWERWTAQIERKLGPDRKVFLVEDLRRPETLCALAETLSGRRFTCDEAKEAQGKMTASDWNRRKSALPFASAAFATEYIWGKRAAAYGYYGS